MHTNLTIGQGLVIFSTFSAVCWAALAWVIWIVVF